MCIDFLLHSGPVKGKMIVMELEGGGGLFPEDWKTSEFDTKSAILPVKSMSDALEYCLVNNTEDVLLYL